jgi:hypothetical protein
MSKHHQASRRRAYGRRQHEIRERTGRREEPVELEFEAHPWDETERPARRIDLGFGSPFRMILGE